MLLWFRRVRYARVAFRGRSRLPIRHVGSVDRDKSLGRYAYLRKRENKQTTNYETPQIKGILQLSYRQQGQNAGFSASIASESEAKRWFQQSRQGQGPAMSTAKTSQTARFTSFRSVPALPVDSHRQQGNTFSQLLPFPPSLLVING
ncbi:hypothetical protein MPH_01539 [Macrophomina phaseolina MS6]|uniref:Uncharacterized protein n=1 Tax=Macrophomina phaseolina (strain MS6) TaxID=1126212 RepID=K2RF69_MACPH|nr:hypothetical protein MPH_01539 [Macrophomina phaseolina MS6]